MANRISTVGEAATVSGISPIAWKARIPTFPSTNPSHDWKGLWSFPRPAYKSIYVCHGLGGVSMSRFSGLTQTCTQNLHPQPADLNIYYRQKVPDFWTLEVRKFWLFHPNLYPEQPQGSFKFRDTRDPVTTCWSMTWVGSGVRFSSCDPSGFLRLVKVPMPCLLLTAMDKKNI